MKLNLRLGSLLWVLLILLIQLGLPVTAQSRPRKSQEVQNMARRFMSGFEVGAFTAEWDSITGSIDTAVVRTGTYSLKCDADSESARKDEGELGGPGGVTEGFFRLYVMFTTLPSSGSVQILRVLDSASGNNAFILTVENSGDVHMNGKFGTAVQFGTIGTGQWYRIEAHVITDPTNGVLEGRIDGGAITTATSQDTGSGLGQTHLGFDSGISGAVAHFDDYAMNDTTGSVNTSWCGEGAIYMLLPDGDSSPLTWTPSTGTVHYLMVNDFDTTDYIRALTNVTNAEDRFTVQNLSNLVDLGVPVNAVMFGVRGLGTALQTRLATLQIRDGSGNTQMGSLQEFGLTFLQSHYPIVSLEQTLGGSPGPLTVQYIDDLLISAIDANSNNREIQFTSIWGCVEVVPSVDPVMTPLWGIMAPVGN